MFILDKIIGKLVYLKSDRIIHNSKKISDIIEPVVLYDNATGTTGNVTLSDSVANFQYIEVYFYNNDNFYCFNKFYNPNGKKICLISTQLDGTTNRIKSGVYTVSNNIITVNYGCDWNLNANAGTTGSARVIYITRVVGYK